jgi:hypothetical protein
VFNEEETSQVEKNSQPIAHPVKAREGATVPNSFETKKSSTSTSVQHDAKSTCQHYLEKHAVIPGSSWGTLPTELQR